MKGNRFPILRTLIGLIFGMVLVGLIRVFQPIIRHALRVSGYQHWVSSKP